MTASGNPMSLGALATAYRNGADPVSVITAVYERIAAHADSALFIHLIPKADAIAAATALRGRDRAVLPLFGVPFVIKDNIDLAGVPTTAGCPSFAYVPKHSATAVEKLLAAGAIPIGKTNLDQFATGLVGVRSPYGVPRNPLDATIIPGGSSSGSACAVAAGLVTFSLGTDTAGSGRVPAAMTNLVGLKPTCGLVSTTGVVPAVRSLDCVSIFAGCVTDARAVLKVIAGFDVNDAFSRLPQPTRPTTSTLRIGIPTATVLNICTPAMHTAFINACDHLRTLGHSIVEIDFAPFAESAKSLYGGAWVAERSAAVGEFIADHPNDCHPVVRDIILAGRSATGVAAHRDRYRLIELRRAAEAAWSHMDVLLLPTVPDYPTVAEVLADSIARNSRLGTFTNFANLLDTAALTIPVGPLTHTLHASVTLFALAWGDELIAELGAALHARAGVGIGSNRQALIPTACANFTGSGISLAVVGAHLSGQPLNHQLLTLGARLEQTTTTAPLYRLFHLTTTPAKPGLIRVADGGASIEVEVWRLSETAFGRFVAAIPAPLGIGRLTLMDGREVSGFICEPYGVSGCTDITAYGGWRAFRSATGV